MWAMNQGKIGLLIGKATTWGGFGARSPARFEGEAHLPKRQPLTAE